MSDPGALPRFVREAMERDEDELNEPDLALVERQLYAPQESSTLDAERSLLALEDSLSDVVEVEAVHVRVSAAMLDLGPARLASAVIEAPHRYAPFYARASRFLDLSEAAVIAALTRLREPARWRPTGFPGVYRLPIQAGPAVRSARASLMRIDPGVTLVEKRERGVTERVLVLEGSYEDAEGVPHRAGEVCELGGGEEHVLRVVRAERCILGSLVFGSGVGAWVRRAFASLSLR